jgi:hypothetical protein
VVESSLDGESWTKIDRQMDNTDILYSQKRQMTHFGLKDVPNLRLAETWTSGLPHCQRALSDVWVIETIAAILVPGKHA